MSSLDLLTIGDCSIDQYMHIEDANVVCDMNTRDCEICFKYDAKIAVSDLSSNIAGNACNVGVSCAKMGLETAVYTIVGDDGNGQKFIEEFRKLGINTDFVVRDETLETDVHTVIVHEGERTIFSYHGDKNYKVLKWPKPKWIYYTSICKGFENFQAELVTYLQKNPDIGVAFNPGTYHFKAGTRAILDILKEVNVLFVNKKEAQVILGSKEETLEILHTELQKLGPKITVITEAESGASAYHQERLLIQPAIKVEKLIDKTGAGDAFAAGVLSALHYNKNLQTALMWGVQNSAHVIQQVGSINGQLSKSEIEKLVQQ